MWNVYIGCRTKKRFLLIYYGCSLLYPCSPGWGWHWYRSSIFVSHTSSSLVSFHCRLPHPSPLPLSLALILPLISHSCQISLYNVLSSQSRSSSSPATLHSKRIRSLHQPFPFHSFRMSSTLQSVPHQLPRETLFRTSFLPQLLYSSLVYSFHSRNSPHPVILTNLQFPLLLFCHCHGLEDE